MWKDNCAIWCLFIGPQANPLVFLMEDPNTQKRLPPGNPITTELSPVLGNVFQSWNFLSCFHKVLGLEKCLSLEDLTTELTGQFSGALFIAQMSMLRILLDEMPIKSKSGKKRDTNVNELTWPELARRYAMVFLSKNGELELLHVHDGNFVKRCLYGDGGPALGALTGLAGLKLDTWLLAEALKQIYSSLNHDEDMLFIDDTDSGSGSVCPTILENEEIPDWVKELEPVKNLKTNVGSRIRKCIQNSIETSPPEWAKNELERSISKEVYKSNASGVTKKAALNVVAHFHKMQKRISSTRNRRNLISISDIVLRKCRILLRQTVNIFCKSSGGKGVIGSPATLTGPLDFRTIDMRLGTGAYCGSHQAFAEDVNELWSSLPTFSKLAGKFEQEYNKEVVDFRQKLSLSRNLKKEIKDILASVSEIPKAPWDLGLCNVCGIDENDKKVRLCDGCNAGYHTYCLIPPFALVPKGNWFCPNCVVDKYVTQDAPSSSSTSLAFQGRNKKNGHFMNVVVKKATDLATMLQTMLQERDYWELTAPEKTCLLEFFRDELLNSKTIRNHIKKFELRNLNNCSLGNEFLGADSVGRLYWKLDASSSHSIIVNERRKPHQGGMRSLESMRNFLEKDFRSSEIDDSCIINDSEHTFPHVFDELYGTGTSMYSSWVCYHSDVEIKRILDFVRNDKPMGENLYESILRSCGPKHEIPDIAKRQDLKELKCSSVELGMNMLCSYYSRSKASEVLQSQYGPLIESDMNMLSERQNYKGEVVARDNMYRCECLEPIIPRGLHCFRCHQTYITKKELRSHGDTRCNSSLTTPFKGADICSTPNGEGTSSVSINEFQKENATFISQKMDPELDVGKLFKVPLSSEKALSGKSHDVLKHLKVCLLDMEAALPEDALRSSKACAGRKRAWRAFVKEALTIYEMVQAMIVFEDMIKLAYLDDSWRNWSSISAAAKISTLAALSLRIYSLDAAFCYNASPCASDRLKLPSTADKKKRKQNESSTAKKRRKLTETKEQVS